MEEKTPSLSNQELKDLVAGLAVQHAETEKLVQQIARHNAIENEKLRRQIGGLGEKWGGFTEGLALPSMTKILKQRFGAEVVSTRVRAWRGGRTMEVDVLAYSNSDKNEVFVVEVKSRLREEGLQQMLQILQDFRDFFPEHRDKTLYGILASVDAPQNVQERVLREGIYLANIHDGVFEIRVPDDFKPHAF
ncbi:MAG TPA: DUF3782 domain-containing protein [Thermoanaerobaculia bacterium]|nr:DUF3782 domain-containing protein [Thermoanaerobaculia bacterium]